MNDHPGITIIRWACKRGHEGRALPELFGVSRITIWNWETGQKIPEWNRLRKVALHFHIPANELAAVAEHYCKVVPYIKEEVANYRLLIEGMPHQLGRAIDNAHDQTSAGAPQDALPLSTIIIERLEDYLLVAPLVRQRGTLERLIRAYGARIRAHIESVPASALKAHVDKDIARIEECLKKLDRYETNTFFDHYLDDAKLYTAERDYVLAIDGYSDEPELVRSRLLVWIEKHAEVINSLKGPRRIKDYSRLARELVVAFAMTNNVRAFREESRELLRFIHDKNHLEKAGDAAIYAFDAWCRGSIYTGTPKEVIEGVDHAIKEASRLDIIQERSSSFLTLYFNYLLVATLRREETLKHFSYSALAPRLKSVIARADICQHQRKRATATYLLNQAFGCKHHLVQDVLQP